MADIVAEGNNAEQTWERKYGTRSEVWEGIAQQTRGRLTKDKLVLSRSGRIVSKRKSEMAKKTYLEHKFAKRAPKVEVAIPEEPKPKKKRRRRKKKVEV
jgi:hypothetical protein